MHTSCKVCSGKQVSSALSQIAASLRQTSEAVNPTDTPVSSSFSARESHDDHKETTTREKAGGSAAGGNGGEGPFIGRDKEVGRERGATWTPWTGSSHFCTGHFGQQCLFENVCLLERHDDLILRYLAAAANASADGRGKWHAESVGGRDPVDLRGGRFGRGEPCMKTIPLGGRTESCSWLSVECVEDGALSEAVFDESTSLLIEVTVPDNAVCTCVCGHNACYKM